MTDPHITTGSRAEQFTTFVEFAAWTSDVAQPATTVIDTSRRLGFTGEITCASTPNVLLYLDGGAVYFAERAGDVSISQLLRDAGIVKPGQLERGIVRIGDVEHLGRLFDRDPSIDRDAVMAMVEIRTEEVVAALAAAGTCAVSASSYRHHPSGIHRWFVGPRTAGGCARPVSVVAQVDTTVVDELPQLQPSSPPPPPPPAVAAAFEPPVPLSSTMVPPSPSMSPSAGLPDVPRAQAPTSATADLIQAEIDSFDVDEADWSATTGGQLRDFRIVWPDGTEDEAITPAAVVAAGSHEHVAPPVDVAPVVETPPTIEALPTIEASSTIEPPATPATPAVPTIDVSTTIETIDESTTLETPETVASVDSPVSAERIDLTPLATPSFTLEPLQVDALPAPDSAVPDEIAAAVRRALHAIEQASLAGPRVAGIDVAPLTQVVAPTVTVTATAPTESARPGPAATVPAQTASPTAASPDVASATVAPAIVAPATVLVEPEAVEPTPVEPAVPAPSGFAPPTEDMRAEAVYARAMAQAEADVGGASGSRNPSSVDPLIARSDAQRGRASVVFVDDDLDDDQPKQRRGALQRLIASLRLKDD